MARKPTATGASSTNSVSRLPHRESKQSGGRTSDSTGWSDILRQYSLAEYVANQSSVRL